MHPTEDAELLRRYADEKSEEAFAELVRRHLDFVYSVALRQAGGDVHLAQDVAQTVFTSLARKAAALAERPVLGGWLYRTTQFAAIDAVRAESRRRVREAEANTMRELTTNPGAEVDWEKLRPVFDQTMGELNDDDRDAVWLRFFEGRSFADVGARLRLTENAARMRVERALDKMHTALERRGVKSTAAALGLALGNQAGVAPPAGLAASVTGAALTGTAASAGGWVATFMSISKIQVGIASAVVGAFATVYVLQGKTNAALRGEIAALQGQPAAVAALRAENRQLADTAAEIEVLRHDDVELARLSQDVGEAQARAQRAKQESARLAAARANQDDVQLMRIDSMNREGQTLVKIYKSLNDRSSEPSLSAEDRVKLQAAAQQMLEAIKAKQQEIRVFTEQARATGWQPLQFKAGTTPSPGSAPGGNEVTNPTGSPGTIQLAPRP